MLISLKCFEKRPEEIERCESEFVVDEVYGNVKDFRLRYYNLENFYFSDHPQIMDFIRQIEPDEKRFGGFKWSTTRVQKEFWENFYEKKNNNYKVRVLVFTYDGKNYLVFLNSDDVVEVYGDEKNFARGF